MRWSPPEQKASGPSPVNRTTPMELSSRTWAKASWSSEMVSGRKALRTSGRLMVILAMPSKCSYLMSWKSRTERQAAGMMALTLARRRASGAANHDDGRGVVGAAAVHGFGDQVLGGFGGRRRLAQHA